MFLPLGDAPNPRGVPVVTYAIIAVNVAVYVLLTLPLSGAAPDPADPVLQAYLRALMHELPAGAPIGEVINQLTQYDLFVYVHGFRPAAPALVTLLQSMFMHAGLLHLFGNMLFLWIYGDNVEHRLGKLAYLFWYLATGAAATLFHAVFNSDSNIPLVGASGAISGVLGFYFVWFPHNTVRLWVFLFPILMNVVELPARVVLGFYLVLDNLLPFLLSGGGGGVAHGAHIGGFVAGLAVAWVMNQRAVSQARAGYDTAPGPEPVRADMPDVAAALAEDDYETAARLYFALPADATRRALSPRDALALAGWLAHHGHGRAALVVYQRLLRDYPIGREAADAHVGAALVLLQSFNQPTAAYQHLVEALDLNPDPPTERTAREALAAIAARQKFQMGGRAR